jgi:NADPH2:quinone reductase
MKAARLHAFGQPLVIEDVPEPEPQLGEALFRVRYAAVNPVDVWLTEGTVWGGKQRLPFIPGAEGAGEVHGRAVVAHGSGLGVRRDGLYREWADVPAGAVVDVPVGVDLQQAAGLGVAGTTAWRLVNEVARIGPEDRVLVLGSSGGVGSLVVQLAKSAGATVWGQSTSEEKTAFIREIGADRAVVAGADDLSAAVGELEPTVVMDPLANGFTAAAISAVQPFGRIVLYGASAGSRADIDLRMLYRNSIQLRTFSGTIEPDDRNGRALSEALQAVARGELRVPIDDVLPLERVNEAHARIRDRRVKGKLLLAP